MSNLRSAKELLRSFPDWTEFNSCFEPSKIRISDIDGIVERNGHFLILDAKRQEMSTLNTGQSILYKRLASVPKFTVLVVFAEMLTDVSGYSLPNGSEKLTVNIKPMRVTKITKFATEDGELKTTTIKADNKWLFDFIKDWYHFANTNA